MWHRNLGNTATKTAAGGTGGKKRKADNNADDDEAAKAAKAAKAAISKLKKQYKAERKKLIEAGSWSVGAKSHKADLIMYKPDRLRVGELIVHVFDSDTVEQKFHIGEIRSKNKKSCWVHYPVDGTEVKHMLHEKDYFNFWAFVRESTEDEVKEAAGHSQTE